MFFSWQEKLKCRYCGEELDRFENRCPYCASLQRRKKAEKKKRENIEGDGFILIGDPTDFKEKKKDKPLQISNGRKVFLSIICAVLPGVGQIAGAIAGLVFMDSEHADRRSFGKALLTASVIMFVLSSILVYFLVLALMTVPI